MDAARTGNQRNRRDLLLRLQVPPAMIFQHVVLHILQLPSQALGLFLVAEVHNGFPALFGSHRAMIGRRRFA
ncbi:MAG: hypothetical protein RMK97_09630 [Sutterellaceae bacterium]|nr:hypothetical protein [Burkholderiaceae bacterium]MCX7902398.1 hypothetical protein [Burkholderiaceae bacterium]MDW8430740.1 hypothetical protein [Sutterellaceae bacterium]